MDRRVSYDTLSSSFDRQLTQALRLGQIDEYSFNRKDAVRHTDSDTPVAVDFSTVAKRFYEMQRNRLLEISNPHLLGLPSDFLYHIGYSSHDDLADKFSDIK
ncbi:hypothetical protein SARC_12571, partial [Sphaeroforma arctica JP610]